MESQKRLAPPNPSLSYRSSFQVLKMRTAWRLSTEGETYRLKSYVFLRLCVKCLNDYETSCLAFLDAFVVNEFLESRPIPALRSGS